MSVLDPGEYLLDPSVLDFLHICMEVPAELVPVENGILYHKVFELNILLWAPVDFIVIRVIDYLLYFRLIFLLDLIVIFILHFRLILLFLFFLPLSPRRCLFHLFTPLRLLLLILFLPAPIILLIRLKSSLQTLSFEVTMPSLDDCIEASGIVDFFDHQSPLSAMLFHSIHQSLVLES